MIYPHDFFPGGDLAALEDLFELNQPVWQAVASLEERLRALLHPNLEKLPVGEPLPRTYVLYEGELFPVGPDFKLVLADATKEKLKVELDGRVLVGASVLCAGAVFMDREIEIGRGVLVEPGAYLKGPLFVGDFTEIRQGAYIRGKCYVGRRCVVGHTTEMKNTIMLDGAKAGHFAYLGDSILGREVNLGAGTKLANLKLTRQNIVIRIKDEAFDTGLRKLGAILGDAVQTGCNSVTNPGTLLGPGSFLLPNRTAGPGYFPPKSILR